jgi:pyrroloquinoline-quinone synthase
MPMPTPTFEAFKQGLLRDHDPLNHSLLVRARDGKLEPPEILAALGQLGHVVNAFPGFLAALLTQMPVARDRLPIVENLLEEHGHLNMEKAHVTTFELLIRGLGPEAEPLTRHAPIPGMRSYLRSMQYTCLHAPWLEGLGLMGMIEMLFAHISPVITAAVVRSGRVPREKLAHFDLHEDVDVDHADGMFAVLQPHWNDEASRRLIQDGLELGVYLDCRLMSDIESFGGRHVRGT